MSDRFNSNEDKRKITTLLNFKNDGEVEKYFPEYFIPPKEDMNSHKLAGLLTAAGVTLYKPISIPELVKTKVEGLINPALDELVENDPTPLLPLGETEFLPKYTPKHSTSEYDLKMYKQILFQWLDNPQADLFDDIVKTVLEVPKEFVFSSGTYSGQVNRLKAIYILNSGTGGKNKPKAVTDMLTKELIDEAGSPMEAVCTIFEHYMPLNSVVDFLDGGFPGLFEPPSYFASLTPDDDYDYLPKIGTDKIAGIPYIGKMKGEVVVPCLVLADSFVSGISDVLSTSASEGNSTVQGLKAPEGESPTKKKMMEYLENFSYLKIGQLFPKAERYSTEDILKKTRNIFAMSFPLHFVASLISNPVTEKSPNYLTFDTPSLYAFSPFHGGLNNLLTRFVINAKDSDSLIYADNWYILYKEDDGTYTYFSIDQEKAEAQAQFEDFRTLGYYLLSRGHVYEGKPTFNLTWLYIATTVLPLFLHNPIGLLQNIQFKMPGLGSGISWTFLINHLRSAVIDAKWRRAGKPRPGSKDWDMKVIVPCGCNLKIEYETRDIRQQLLELKQNTPTDGYLQTTATHRPSTTPTPYVKLDLLGWGAAYSHQLDMYVPVLEDERMFKSIMLPQKDDRHDYGEKPWNRYAYDVARLEAMRMVGAWRYAPLDAACQNNAADARRRLIRMKKLTPHELAEAFKMTEFSGEFSAADVTFMRSMTFEDLISLNSPKRTNVFYTQPSKWELNLLKAIPRTAKLPGMSLLAMLKIEEWFSKRDMLTTTQDPATLSKFIHSTVYADAVAEISSFRNFLRPKKEPFQMRPAVATKEGANDPYVAYKIHHEHVDTGTISDKTGFGVSKPVGLPPVLSKGQRRRANRMATVVNLQPPLIEGTTPMRIPELKSSSKISKKVEEKPLKAAFVPTEEATTPQLVKVDTTGYKQVNPKDLVGQSIKFIADSLVRSQVKYGQTDYTNRVIRVLDPDIIEKVMDQIDKDYGETMLDKVFP